jgi:prefoldin alpha subunit
MATSSRKPTITSQQQRHQTETRRGQPSPDAGEQQVRQLLSDVRLLENSARILQSRLDIISAALSETLTAVQTLEGSREATEGTESLIPIGSGSFVKARLAEPQKAIIGIGAGVCIEKTTDDSIKELRVRSSELEKARGTITNQLEQVLGQTEAYRGKLSDLVRRRGGGLEVV